jgi:hypothetical protein
VDIHRPTTTTTTAADGGGGGGGGVDGGRGSVKRYKLIGLEDAIFKEKVLALFGKKISECSCLKKR